MKHKKLLKKLPAIILLLALLGTMFFLSGQTATVSSVTSGRIVKLLSRLGITVSDHIVRKCAHFTEFACLGILTGIIFESFAALPVCALVAMGDEFHQKFVAGRGPMWSDVCLDCAGALVGIILILILYHLKKRKRKNK